MSNVKDSGEKLNLDAVRENLLARKEELENELAELASEKFPTDQVLDQGDQALTSSIEALRNSLQNNEFGEYTRIIKALEMVDSGDYGTCVDCDGKISKRRLISYPNATRCVSCQEAQEEKVEF